MIKRESWVINMILKNYFLKDMIMPCGPKTKKNGLIKKNLQIYLICHHQKGDEEEVKEGQGLSILTPNKLLTRLPISLAQIKAGKNSYKLKNEIREMLFLLYQYNKITKKAHNNFFKPL